MAILVKVCKQDNFQSNDPLKLRFTNIRGIHFNFIVCNFLLQSNSPIIVALYEINLGNSTHHNNFPVRRYLPLIEKDSITNLYGLAVYVKFLCFQLALLCVVSDFCSSINHCSLLFAKC